MLSSMKLVAEGDEGDEDDEDTWRMMWITPKPVRKSVGCGW
jgi:hypothetical protein